MTRAEEVLATAEPNDCLVVALHGTAGDLVVYTGSADPARLVNIARSLLVQARDALAEGCDRTAGPSAALYADITDAILFLPEPDAD